MLCRVYQKPDGSVAVIHPNPRLQLPGESDQAFLDRICAQDAPNSGLETLPYIDMDRDTLPPRTDRHQWTVDKEKVVKKDKPR